MRQNSSVAENQNSILRRGREGNETSINFSVAVLSKIGGVVAGWP